MSMNKTPNIRHIGLPLMGKFANNRDQQKRAAFRRIGQRHNHIFYYITYKSQLQEENSNSPNFSVLNKNILWTLLILGIAIQSKVCYTIDVARRYKPMVK